jgi:hypothetical protein
MIYLSACPRARWQGATAVVAAFSKTSLKNADAVEEIAAGGCCRHDTDIAASVWQTKACRQGEISKKATETAGFSARDDSLFEAQLLESLDLP